MDIALVLGWLAEAACATLDPIVAAEVLGTSRIDLGTSMGTERIERCCARSGFQLTWRETTLRDVGVAEPWATVIPGGAGMLYVDRKRRLRHVVRIARDGIVEKRSLSTNALAELLNVSPTSVVVGFHITSRLPLDQLRIHTDGHHAPFRRVMRLVRLERADIPLAIVYGSAVALTSLATPVAVQALVNTVSFGSVLLPVAVLTLLFAGVMIFAAVSRGLQAWVVETIQQRLFVRGVLDLTHRLLDASTRDARKVGLADLTGRFFELASIQKSLATLLLDGFDLALTLFIGLALLAVYHPLLLVFAGAVTIGLVVVIVVGGRGAFETAYDESSAKYEAARSLETIVRLHGPLQTAGGRAYAIARADAIVREYRSMRGAHFRKLIHQLAGSSAVKVIGASTLLGVGAVLVLREQLTLGQLVASELVFATIATAIAKLYKQLESAYDLAASSEKLAAVTDIQPDQAYGEPLRGTGPLRVEVTDLVVGYEEVPPILTSGSLSLRAGEAVAVLGPPGAGRSTLLDVLACGSAPMDGTITYDAVDARLLDHVALRATISSIREARFLADTVLANLRLTAPDSSLEEIMSIIDIVGLSDVITRLRDGLSTKLTHEGAPLSRTQARRLVLARALLGCPRLIILDGALDGLGLDSAAKSRIVDRVFDGRATVIVSTDDPEVARRCARRFELRDAVLREVA